GGDRMAAAGLRSLFPIAELSVMGLVEVIPHIRRIAQRMAQTVDAAADFAPDLIVTIDAPGFSLRLTKRLRARLGPDPRIVHYVVPTVWAWKPKRAAKMAALYDAVLCLLPFEPPYFEREGLPAVFVGHPAAADGAAAPRDAARDRLGLPADRPILLVALGSRKGELRRLAPIFADATLRLRNEFPDLLCLFPTVETVVDVARAQAAAWPVEARVFATPDERALSMAAADAAIAASGTVGLELAAAGTPHLIAYRLAPLTFAIAKRLVKARFAHLANILADQALINERIQDACTADAVAEQARALLRGESWPAEAVAEQIAKLAAAPGGVTPAAAAARAALTSRARAT
ncbi:MAG: lipid-A-disaccharide synthase, partial [Pseudomonadota bacterium]